MVDTIPKYIYIFYFMQYRHYSTLLDFSGGGSIHVMKKCGAIYDDIISVENLLLAWREFRRGKKKKKDVQEFEMHLMKHVLDLHSLSFGTSLEARFPQQKGAGRAILTL